MKKSILFFLFSILAFPSISTTIYVDANVQGGVQDGASWANAFSDLQNAIAAAQYGDEIWVAQGTYLPTDSPNRNIFFLLKNGVKLYGGFTGVETALPERDWEANPTILSGDIGIPGDSTDNSYTIIYCNAADSTTVIDGFVITGGNAGNSSTSVPPSSRTKSGGGLYLEGFSTMEDVRPQILNCRFEYNTAISNGGGVYMRSSAAGYCSPYFENCVFEGNHAQNGGGVYKEGGSLMFDMILKGCDFVDNISGFYGGGLRYNNTIEGKDIIVDCCQFISNHSDFSGGAFYQDTYTALAGTFFNRCHFYENTATAGGVVSIFNWTANNNIRIYKSLLFYNNSPEGTVGIYDGIMSIDSCIFSAPANQYQAYLVTSQTENFVSNSIFLKTHTTGGAVGLLNQAEGICVFTNCTLFESDGANSYLMRGGNVVGDKISIENSLVAGNDLEPEGFLIQLGKCEFSISHSLLDISSCDLIADLSDTEGTVTCGPGMLYLQDPLFTDTAASDFTLLPCSPAIDAGNNAIIDSLGILTDLAGNPRIRGGTVDMGAYEAPPFNMGVPIVQQPACHGENGTVAFQPQHGCPPFFFEWDGGPNGPGSAVFDTLPAVLTLPAGSYAVTLTDGRMNSDTAFVSLQAPASLAAAATATAVNCPAGPGGTAAASPSGGTAPYAYEWSNGDTLAAIANLAAGTYAFTLTDANGCSLTDSVAVTTTGSLPLGIDVSPITCHDSADGTATVTPISGTAPFAWGWPNGETSPTLDSIGGGSYAVTVTDALGCKGMLSFSITPPPALALSVSATDVTCAGASNGTAAVAASGGTPGYTYLWDTGAATATAANLAPGWHTVTVTDANGCTDTAGVAIAEPAPLTADIAAPALVCFGETGTAAALPQGGTPPYAYLWQGGQTDSLLTDLPPGPYAVTVTDANGCTLTAQTTIAENPSIEILFEIENATAAGAPDGSITLTLTLGGTPPYTYLWNTADTAASLQNIPPGSYAVTVTDANGCTQDFTFEVDIETAAGERDTEVFQARIVPNPSGRDGGARLMVTGLVSPKITVTVYDAGGRQVSQDRFFTGNEYALPGSLPAGLYWVLLESETGRRRALRWVVQ